MNFEHNFIMTSDPKLMVNIIEPLVQDHKITDIEIVGDCAVLAQAKWKWPDIPTVKFVGIVVIDSWTKELSLASRTYWRDGKEVSHEEIPLDEYIGANQGDISIPDILDMVLGKIWET